MNKARRANARRALFLSVLRYPQRRSERDEMLGVGGAKPERT
jgi:hypothetical protein